MRNSDLFVIVWTILLVTIIIAAQLHKIISLLGG